MASSMGAKMVFGTDAIYEHGDNAKQFKYMVNWGMTFTSNSSCN